MRRISLALPLALLPFAACTRAPIDEGAPLVADLGTDTLRPDVQRPIKCAGPDNLCWEVDLAVPPAPTPQPSDSCKTGQRRWCDGLDYDGWGQVDCDPSTGKWRTKIDDAGQLVLDCRDSLAAGRRPDTLCACYHYFFSPDCCERPARVLPDGTDGQICPPSAGGLCSTCNPQANDCIEPGAKCIITSAHETFCGRLCDTTACPSGYTCMTVKLAGNQTSQQCVPEDLSCFY